MKDKLKILQEEYLSNHLLDKTQISNLSLHEKIILYKSLKLTQPQIEDELQILKWIISATIYWIILIF